MGVGRGQKGALGVLTALGRQLVGPPLIARILSIVCTHIQNGAAEGVLERQKSHTLAAAPSSVCFLPLRYGSPLPVFMFAHGICDVLPHNLRGTAPSWIIGYT